MRRVKIATFNIAKDEGEFPNRIYELSNLIKARDFDIICFQEDYKAKSFSSSKYLNLELNYNYLTTETRQKNRKGKFSSSNLTILSKYEINLIDEIYFNKAKEDERACQFVEIDIEGEKMLLANTHLCHLSSKNRVEQIETILAKVDKLNYSKSFFCGDLNALPVYEEIKLIKDAGFKDKNKEFTHSDKVVLDYIFYKTTQKCDIVSSIILKGYSDHHCLINSFKF